MPELLPFIMPDRRVLRTCGTQHLGRVAISRTLTGRALSQSFEFLCTSNPRAGLDCVEVLLAARGNIDALTAQVDAARTVLYSAIDDVFGRSTKRDTDQVASLKSLSTKIVDGVHHTPEYVQSGVPFITVENLTRGSGIDFGDTRFVSEKDHREFIKRAHPEKDDVLISKDGTLGVPRVVDTDREFSIFVSVALVKPKRDLLNAWFLRFYFESSLFRRHIASRVSGSALKHIHLVDLRESPVPLMTIDDQKKTAINLSAIHSALSLAETRVAQAREFYKRALTTTMEGLE